MLANVVETVVEENSKLVVVLDEIDTYIDEGATQKYSISFQGPTS